MNEVTKQRPNNYLVWAILSTVLCCVPFGIVAIVKSTKVDTLWNDGRYDEAVRSAEDAKKWAIIAAVSSAVVCVIYLLILVIAAIAGEL